LRFGRLQFHDQFNRRTVSGSECISVEKQIAILECSFFSIQIANAQVYIHTYFCMACSQLSATLHVSLLSMNEF
jgi:hypothetical protein